MNSRKLLTVVFCVLYSLNSFSANDIYFSKIGIEQGLSQLSVQSIYQDELGAMWFATREGLNRYNGNAMDVFRPVPNDSNSLGENLILHVCGDKNGHIFIHTQNGINEFNLRTAVMRSIQRKFTDGIAYGIQNLWIAENNTLYTYKDGKKELYCVVNQSNSPIKKILHTVDQRIFVGTISSGVYVIDQNKKIRIVIPNCSQVSDIFEDSKKNIWVSTWEQGLYKIERSGNILNFRHDSRNSDKSISSNFTRAVCEDNNGFIWIGTKKGLDRLTPETGIFKHYDSDGYNNRQLSNESVWALTKDNQGTTWAGRYLGVINTFNPKFINIIFITFRNGVWFTNQFRISIRIIKAKNGNLYLCSEGNGLIYYNVNNKTYRIFKTEDNNSNSLTADNIKAAYFDRQTNELWIGTHLGGLCVLNTKTFRFLQYKNLKPEWQQTNILSSIQPYQGNLLIGTHNGLFLFDRKTRQFSLFSEKVHKTVSFIQDAKTDNTDNLWIASFNGVYKYNLKTKKISSFFYNSKDTSSLSNNNVSKILLDSKNRIWIATSGGGINQYKPKTNNFVRYNTKHLG